MKRPLALAAVFFFAVGATEPSERAPPACMGPGFVFFESGSSLVDRVAGATLERFVHSIMPSSPPSRVALLGHADRVGDSAANLRLSRRRAEAVRDFLAAHGILESQMRVEAAGEGRPLVETPDGIAEPRNRFVEFAEFPDPAEMARRDSWRAEHGRPPIIC